MPACQLRPLCAHVGSPRGRRRRRRRRCCQKALIYHNIHHSGKQMSDSSPIFRRKPRHKAPIIKDSPKSPPSKKPVPPSPVVPENDSVSATFLNVKEFDHDFQARPPLSRVLRPPLSRVLLLSAFLLLHLPAHARKKIAGVLFLFL